MNLLYISFYLLDCANKLIFSLGNDATNLCSYKSCDVIHFTYGSIENAPSELTILNEIIIVEHILLNNI